MRIARGGKSLRQLNSGGGTPASPPPPSVQFSTTSVTLAEGNSGTTNFVYTVTRTGDTTGASSVDWAVTGSGVNPANAADFVGGVLPSGTLSFIAGDTSKTITVPVQGDTAVEPDETFTVTLSNPVNATIGSPSTAAGTITNDDSAGGGGTLGAPTLGYPSPIASNPTAVTFHIPVDWQTGDVAKLARSASPSMTSPTILTHTITDADIAAGTFSIGLSGVTLSGITYFQGYGAHSGVDSANLSGIVAWGDTTAPVIATSGTQTNTETTQLGIARTATDTGGVPALVSDGTSPGWYIASGADQLQYQIAVVGGVATAQWIGNGTESFASPNDQDQNNTYLVNIVAVDYGGNQSSPLALTTTVTQIDQTPVPFTFTPVNNASLSTQYVSNTVTVSGLEPGFNIASSVAVFDWSKDGGTTWHAAGSLTMANGETLTLRGTSPASNSNTTSGNVTVGTYTTSWSIATPGSSAHLVTGTGSTGAGTDRSKFVNATSFQSIVNANVGVGCLVRANLDPANTQNHVEATVNNMVSGADSFIIGFSESTLDLNQAGTGFINDSNLPGASAGPNGITFVMTLGGTGALGWGNGGSTAGFTLAAALANGDTIGLDTDTVANTIKFYHYRTATSTSTLCGTRTLTSKIPSTYRWFQGGARGTGSAGASDATTVNFGATTYLITPTTGYTYYA